MTAPKITFLDAFTLAISPEAFQPIQALGELTNFDRTTPVELLPRAASADIILTNKVPLTAQTLAQLDRLKLICVTATGYNVVDVNAAAERSIAVCNVPEYGTDTVAQHVFALILELFNHVGMHDASVHRGEWARSMDWCYTLAPLHELRGKKIGIVGFGRIGQRVGEIARAFGMDVLACGGRSAPPSASYPYTWISLDELFQQADVISLHCPLTEATSQMINRSRLATMKPEAILINCSRGSLVVEQDLADALNAGVVGAAAVDVVLEEPIRGDNPLLKARNCVMTPHIAWATNQAKTRLIQQTAHNIAAFFAGNPVNVVNAQQLNKTTAK